MQPKQMKQLAISSALSTQPGSETRRKAPLIVAFEEAGRFIISSALVGPHPINTLRTEMIKGFAASG